MSWALFFEADTQTMEAGGMKESLLAEDGTATRVKTGFQNDAVGSG